MRQPKFDSVFGLGLIRFCDAFVRRDREFCHAIEQFHGCMSEHLGTFAEAIGRGPGETALGSFSVVPSADRVGRKYVLFRPVEAERARILAFPRVGAEPCAPGLPIPA